MSINDAYTFFDELRMYALTMSSTHVVAPGHPVAFVLQQWRGRDRFTCLRGNEFNAGTCQVSTA